jgi:transposase
MKEVTIIGVDLAKNVFQVHGSRADGSVAFRIKLTRAKFLPFLAAQPCCVVAMEACAGAHHWGRTIGDLGHAVRLIPPIYVKPFVKRQKNDAADAEAIAEAASRPTMRFVGVKSEAQQAAGTAFRTRDLFVRQRTQTINALRGHLAEYGVIAPKGIAHLDRLVRVVEDPDSGLPQPVRALARMLLDQIAGLQAQIAELEREIRARARCDDVTSRLMTIPGIGPICAAAMVALAPPAETFAKGRDFAAWLGLTPLQRSSGGKERLGRTSKMGQRDLRRLLIIGAMSVVRWAARRGTPEGTWLARMLARKPRMLVAVALANRMARIAWALMAKGGTYRAPAVAA